MKWMNLNLSHAQIHPQFPVKQVAQTPQNDGAVDGGASRTISMDEEDALARR